MPARCVLVPAQRQRRAQGRRRAPGEGHVHARKIAFRHQPQPRRGASGRRGQHRGGDEVAAVILARRVIAVQREHAAVAVHAQVFDVQPSARRVQAAARAADVGQRFAFLQQLQPVDADRARLQRQRRRDVRQHVGPLRQFERLVAARQVQGRAAHVQRVQAQALAQQRADRRIDHHRVRIEHDPAHRAARGLRRHAVGIALARHGEMHAVQGHRPGGRTFRAFPRQFAAGGQARDDLPQQRVAAADRHQQPVQQQRGGDDQRERAEAAAQCDLALPLLAQGAQLGDVRLALRVGRVRRQRIEPVAAVACVAFAPVHGHALTGPRRC